MWSLVGVTGLSHLPWLELHPAGGWGAGTVAKRVGLRLTPPPGSCLLLFSDLPYGWEQETDENGQVFLSSKLSTDYSRASCFCDKCIHYRKILCSV